MRHYSRSQKHKKIMRVYYKQLLAKTSENLDETDKFIENATTAAHEKKSKQFYTYY